MSTDHGRPQTAQAASEGKGGWVVLGLISVTLVAFAAVGVFKRAAAENRQEALAGPAKPVEKSLEARMTELRINALVSPDEGIPEVEALLEDGTIPERQGAFAILGNLDDPRAATILNRWLDSLQSGNLPPECRLDLTEAAAKHKTPEIESKLAAYESSLPKGDPLAAYRDALVGGNAARGLQIFSEKAEAQCLRCHKINGGGGEVGPDLTGVGSRHPREYFLESILFPNKEIAKGFEGVVLALADGTILSGVLRGEDDKEVKVMTAEGKLIVVPQDEIEERKAGVSAMPEDFAKHLSKLEIRDLIELLSESKETSKETKPAAKPKAA
jgi:quinoprotein glucose dehydrogenase